MIGAGSASLGLNAAVDTLRTPSLSGVRLSLIDTDGAPLEQLLATSRRISNKWTTEATFVSRSDRREVLGGADVMVILVAVDREATWRQDRVTHLIAGIWHDTGAHAEAINALNRAVSDGSKVITNLPEDAIDEVGHRLQAGCSGHPGDEP